jgi:hypothetical protein
MKPQRWLTALILLCGAAIALAIVFISPAEDIRLKAFCQLHGYGWRGTSRNGIYCVDERGRLIPPEKAWRIRPPTALSSNSATITADQPSAAKHIQTK